MLVGGDGKSVEMWLTNPALLAAAELNDVLGERETTYEEARERFGGGVTSVVLEVTEDNRLLTMERKHRQIEHAVRVSRRAKLVKPADERSQNRK